MCTVWLLVHTPSVFRSILFPRCWDSPWAECTGNQKQKSYCPNIVFFSNWNSKKNLSNRHFFVAIFGCTSFKRINHSNKHGERRLWWWFSTYLLLSGRGQQLWIQLFQAVEAAFGLATQKSPGLIPQARRACLFAHQHRVECLQIHLDNLSHGSVACADRQHHYWVRGIQQLALLNGQIREQFIAYRQNFINRRFVFVSFDNGQHLAN